MDNKPKMMDKKMDKLRIFAERFNEKVQELFLTKQPASPDVKS